MDISIPRIEWPLTRFPSGKELSGAEYPTAMESQTESFATLIHRNVASKMPQKERAATAPKAAETRDSPEERRVAILADLASDRSYMDLVCVVGSYNRRQGILCHRIIVAKQSPVLTATLEKVNLGIQLPIEVELSWRITAQGFNKVLDWCYKAIRPTIHDSFEQLCQLFVAATVLKINGLADITLEVLRQKDLSTELENSRVGCDEYGTDNESETPFEKKLQRYLQCLGTTVHAADVEEYQKDALTEFLSRAVSDIFPHIKPPMALLVVDQ
ncbi:hypothetical protein TWF481_003141 [Arthrobotrys musiformis]|uniref:BTB domain-containing protein n=1 Tax=Arthrobotrys musiformis TaxID=47236 RepID=A0AAV9VPN4_9PEZI